MTSSEVAEAGADSPDPAPVPTGHDVPRAVSVLVFLRDRGIFVLWGILIVVFAIWASPYFATVDNALLIANAASITALFAAGVGIGIMTGVLDLSLRGTAAIASCVCGWLLTNGQATWIGLLAGLACGVVVGLVNGAIAIRGFNPIIVTIGTLSVLTGLASVVAGGYTFPGLNQLEFMGTDRYFAVGEFPGIPAPVFIVTAVFVAGTVFLTRTRDGIRLMAVGGNAEAVRRSGIHSPRYQVLGFVISGVLAAVGGLVSTAVTTEATPAASPAIIFNALTAVAGWGRAHRGARQPAADPGWRADPGHDLQRLDDPRHPAVLGDRVHRRVAARLAGPRARHRDPSRGPADGSQPVRPREEG